MNDLTNTYPFALTKNSSNEQIKVYFEKVLELYNSNESFPIDLDDVWPLVYSERGKAVRALKNGFMEGDDYTSFAQNGKREIGGTVKIVYKLSVSCMEYLIAKKVRPVFDVYRQVFKKVATETIQPRSNAEMLLMYAQQMVEQERKVKQIEANQEDMNRRLSEVEERTSTSMKYTTIVGFANRFGIRMPREKACVLGRIITNICRKYGYEMGKVLDPRFGWVKTYPDEALQEGFSREYPNIDFNQYN